jgi:hypothetical protein
VRDLSATTTASTSAPAGRGHADGLHHAHAGAHQVVGQIGGAGEVVGDAAQRPEALVAGTSGGRRRPAAAGTLSLRAESSTMPRSLTKMFTADSGV